MQQEVNVLNIEVIRVIAIATLVRTQNQISEWRREAPPLAYWVLACPIESDYSYNSCGRKKVK